MSATEELFNEWRDAKNGFSAGVDFKVWLAVNVESLRAAVAERDAAIERRDGVMRGLMIALDLRDSRKEAAYDRVCNKFGTGIGAAWLDVVRMYEDESAVRASSEVKP